MTMRMLSEVRALVAIVVMLAVGVVTAPVVFLAGAMLAMMRSSEAADRSIGWWVGMLGDLTQWIAGPEQGTRRPDGLCRRARPTDGSWGDIGRGEIAFFPTFSGWKCDKACSFCGGTGRDKDPEEALLTEQWHAEAGGMDAAGSMRAAGRGPDVDGRGGALGGVGGGGGGGAPDDGDNHA